MKSWLAALFALVATQASFAQNRRISIQSKLDKFELFLTGAKGTVAGKSADVKIIHDLLPAVTSPLGNECPTFNGPPDITVREGANTRLIYVKSGLITDQKKCLNVSGEGLYYFPIHRDFLIGSNRDGLSLNSPVKVFRNGKKLFELKKSGTEWLETDTRILLDWNFVERFLNSLEEFDVRLRVQSGLAEGKPKMIVQIAGQPFEFIKVTNTIWALKKPGATFLVASDSWSFWQDFDLSLVQDRYATEIEKIKSPETSLEEKLNLLEKLDHVWSKNLRNLYAWLLVNEKEPRIQGLALKRLKGKPSLEIVGAVVTFLEQTNDEDFKQQAVNLLKIQNPKGPRYNSSLPQAERMKVIEFWRTWWAQNKKQN